MMIRFFPLLLLLLSLSCMAQVGPGGGGSGECSAISGNASIGYVPTATTTGAKPRCSWQVGGGAIGPTGATGPSGPTGSVGAIVQKSGAYSPTCADMAAYTQFQSTTSNTYTLSSANLTGCASNAWMGIFPGTGASATFTLSGITVNGQSTLTSLAAGTGTAAYAGYRLAVNPASTTDLLAFSMTGANGAAGSAGATGATGSTGATGATGATGTIGNTQFTSMTSWTMSSADLYVTTEFTGTSAATVTLIAPISAQFAAKYCNATTQPMTINPNGHAYYTGATGSTTTGSYTLAAISSGAACVSITTDATTYSIDPYSIGPAGSTGPSGTTGSTGSTGPTGSTGTLGTVVQKSTGYSIQCSDFSLYNTLQATSSITFTLAVSSCTGAIEILPGPSASAAFTLSGVTVNGQSTLNTLPGGSGTAGYPGCILFPNPASSTDYIGIGCSSSGGGGSGTVTSIICGTGLSGGTITSTGTCAVTGAAGQVLAGATPALTAALALGTDNSAAGTVQLSNGSSNAHTIFGSAATTSNTILGFAVAPTTGDIVECVVSTTICTLTDSGVLAANVNTNSSNFTSGHVVSANGNHTTADGGAVAANLVVASAPGAGIAHFAGSTQTATSSAVVSADLSITTTTCTAPQVVTAISGGAVGTCTAPIMTENSQSAAYTTLIGDAGKMIYHPSADTTARTWTIDSNANVAFVVGTCISFFNDTSAGTVTIAITSDTLVFAGAGTTGSRTLAAGNVATACKMTTVRWMISGSSGLT